MTPPGDQRKTHENIIILLNIHAYFGGQCFLQAKVMLVYVRRQKTCIYYFQAIKSPSLPGTLSVKSPTINLTQSYTVKFLGGAVPRRSLNPFTSAGLSCS